ncbi:MAG: type II toxin-antitoxin system RelE/ParE family toxin [Deltaproteobacteria bacterium]|nr:type II toxin-antitoxin system RelE/ParE family toxin [Deltaproteobacteria bacterium]
MLLHRRLRIPPEVVSLIAHLPPSLKQKVRGGLEALVDNPHEGKPLHAELEGLWSLRVGRFRIIYRLPESTVIDIVTIGPRETIYQELTGRR